MSVKKTTDFYVTPIYTWVNMQLWSTVYVLHWHFVSTMEKMEYFWKLLVIHAYWVPKPLTLSLNTVYTHLSESSPVIRSYVYVKIDRNQSNCTWCYNYSFDAYTTLWNVQICFYIFKYGFDIHQFFYALGKWVEWNELILIIINYGYSFALHTYYNMQN